MTTPDNAQVRERACACCGEPAVCTEFSPYMDDYCDACTTTRCDLGRCQIGLESKLGAKADG